MKVILQKAPAIFGQQNGLLAKTCPLMTSTLREELGSTQAVPSFLSAGYWLLRTCLAAASFSYESLH